MGGIVLVLIILEQASIYTFLDMAFDLVAFGLRGGFWTPSDNQPFRLRFQFEVDLNQFFVRQGWGQHSTLFLVFSDQLAQTRVQVQALSFSQNLFLRMEVPLPIFLFFHSPHGFRGQLTISVLAALLGIGK